MAGIEKGVGFPITAIDQFSAVFGNLARQVGGASDKVRGLNGFIAAMTGGLGAAGIGALVKNVIDAHDEVNKLSQKLGVGVGALSQFKYAAELSDVSTQTLGAGIKGLSQRMIEAGDSSSKAGRLMAAMGVDVRGGTLPAIEKMADVFARLPDGPTKAALAVEIFGKAGMEMIPLLNQGSEGIRGMREEADRLGLTMTESTAAAAEQFNDNLRAVRASGESLGVALLNQVAPALLAISTAMKNAAMEGGVFKGILEGLREAWSQAFFGNPEQNRITAIRKELALLEPMLQEAPGLADRVAGLNKELQGLLSFGEVGARAGGSKPAAAGGTSKAVEDLYRKILAQGEAAGKATKAMKDLGLADAHVTAYLKALGDEQERVNELLGHAARLRRDGQSEEVDAINARDEMLDQLELEVTLLRMSEPEQERYLQSLEDERIIKLALTDADEERIRGLLRERDALRQARVSTGEYAAEWQNLGRNISSGFTQMFSDLLDGRLNDWRGFTRSLGDIFKRSVTDFVGNAINALMKNVMNSLANGGGNLMGGVNPLALAFAGGSIGANLITGALGSGPRGQQIGTYAGGAGATIGFMIGGPIGAVAGAVLGGLIGHFSDPDGLAQRSATFGSMTGATGPTGYSYTSPFGTFGLSDTSWFSDQDMGEQLRRYFGGMAAWERSVAGYLTDDETARVSAALGGSSTRYGFGEEHGDFAGTLGQMTADRAQTILNAVDPVLARLAEGFEGTGEQLGQFVLSLLGMRQALADMNVTGLNMETLQLMGRAGETLEQTFQRVAGTWSWFTQNFYTEAERLEMATTQVNGVFAQLGLEVPGTVTEFRRLVEGLDLSTEEGRRMWDMLMGVAPAFLTVTNAAGEATTATDDLSEALLRQAEIQRQIEESVRNSRESQLAAIVGARGGLADFLNRTNLSDLSPLTPQERLAEARKQYEAVLAAAMSGDLGAAGRLGGVAENYLQIAREMFASGSGYISIYDQVMGQVKGVDQRLAIDEQMLRATLGMATDIAAQTELLIEVKALLIDIRDKAPVVVSADTKPR
jgi:hypothetical protein